MDRFLISEPVLKLFQTVSIHTCLSSSKVVLANPKTPLSYTNNYLISYFYSITRLGSKMIGVEIMYFWREYFPCYDGPLFWGLPLSCDCYSFCPPPISYKSYFGPLPALYRILLQRRSLSIRNYLYQNKDVCKKLELKILKFDRMAHILLKTNSFQFLF